MTYTRCLMILADGARADVFEELLRAGRLRHIERHLVARGGYRRAITAFPSTTGPAYMPFLTGCLPGTCNVPGIRWLDKGAFGKRAHARRRRSYVGIETFAINKDLRPDIATLFGLIPQSYSVFNSVCRDVAHNLTRVMRMWYWYYAHLTDRWGFVDAVAIDKLRDLVRRDFGFAFIVFPGIDEFAHLSNPHHPRVVEAYATVDRAVGLVADQLQRMQRYDETLLWIVSDHGLSATHTHFCVNTFLEQRGLRTFFYPLVYKRGCVAANMMSGNGMTHCYFRHPDGWDRPMHHAAIEQMSPGLHAALVAQPAVDLVATRDLDGWLVVQSRRGRARLRLDGELITYRPATHDPFGYPSLPETLHAEQQLQRTLETAYPDALYQLAHLFVSRRTGDLIISATPGFDLRDQYEIPEHKSSHGSLHREHMVVPLVSNMPLADRALRTVDVFPTILTAMGHAVPDGIDGRVAC